MIRVLIVGPDGTGKTSAAHALQLELASRGFRARARHGAPAARPSVNLTATDQPHRQQPRRLPASAAKLLIAFLRYVATSARVAGNATQIDIVERGWDDQLVDPIRYRLHPASDGIVRVLGRLLPRNDLCVLLAGDAALVYQRKAEITTSEIDRQIAAWRRVAPRSSKHITEMDCVQRTPEAIARAAADLAVDVFGRRDRWRALWPSPSRVDLRLVAVAGAFTASKIYEPGVAPGRVANRLAKAAFRTGLRVRTTAPLPPIRSILASCGVGGLAVATVKSSRRGRFVVGVANEESLVAVLKVGELDDTGLANEAQFLETLESTGLAPRLLSAGQRDGRSYLATAAVKRIARSDTVSVEEAADLATRLQTFDHETSIVHGDLTPWNLIPSDDGLVVVDWEHASIGSRPLYDLAHFVIQRGALTRRGSPEEAVALLTGRDSPGVKHLTALGIDGERAPALVRRYLSTAPAPTDLRVVKFRSDVDRLLP